MKVVAVLLLLVLLNPVGLALGREPTAISLRWADAGRLATGKQVSVITTDGAIRKGRVRAMDADGIDFEDTRTPRIPRAAVSEIRVTEYVGGGRRFGKLIGGAAGLTIGLCAAAVIGLREGSGSRASDKALAGILGIGGLPIGMTLGYLIGRQADKRVTAIRIIPS